MTDRKSSPNQEFLFNKVVKENGVKSIDDGEYEIKLASNANKLFDIDGGSEDNGARVQIWDDQNISQQRFLINYIGNGLYRIQSKKTKKVLDVTRCRHA